MTRTGAIICAWYHRLQWLVIAVVGGKGCHTTVVKTLDEMWLEIFECQLAWVLVFNQCSPKWNGIHTTTIPIWCNCVHMTTVPIWLSVHIHHIQSDLISACVCITADIVEGLRGWLAQHGIKNIHHHRYSFHSRIIQRCLHEWTVSSLFTSCQRRVLYTSQGSLKLGRLLFNPIVIHAIISSMMTYHTDVTTANSCQDDNSFRLAKRTANRQRKIVGANVDHDQRCLLVCRCAASTLQSHTTNFTLE